ncbi:MAG: hypothetical protein IKF65_02765, partial [Clostridia bacterium]|nr:hypothetical protein [Clostridia bacterium]
MIVKYRNVLYNAELNIGVARNDGKSHSYTIQNRIADLSVNNNSVIDAPMPGKTGVSVNNDSINSISSTEDSVKKSDAEYLDLARRY